MAHLGNTVINGVLRVLGGENVDTINGVTVGNSPKFTDASVTASGNHYTPATVSGQDKSASASGATAAWSIDVVKGVTLNTDGKGHVTGISVTSGKIPGNPNTDTKVTQTADDSTDSDSYEVLFSGSANNTTATEGAKKSSRLKINPKYGRVITGGPLIVEADNAVGSYDEGIRINRGKSGYATLHIGGADGSTTGTGASQWWIGCNPAGTARKLWIAQNGSTASSTYFGSDADGTVSPYLNLGTSGSIASGDTKAVTGGVVYNALTDGSKFMVVGKISSRSTSTVGTWTSMCRNDQTGSPTCPTGSWYNIISLNNWTDSSTNWVSQLAIATQEDKSGVWWRCNDSGGTDISSSTWYNLIDTRSFESVLSSKITMGNGDSVSGDGSLLFMKSDYGTQSTSIQFSPYQGFVYADYNSSTHYWSIHSGNNSTTGAVRDANSVNTNGFYYYTSNGPSHGFQSTDGAIYAQFHSTPWGAEIAQDYRDGDLCVRGKNGGTWTAWRPIPAGLTYSDGEINTGHSRNCNDYSNSSGIFYFLSGGPDALSGFKAPDSSGTAFCHHYASNSWANMWAQDFYNDGAMYVRSNAGNGWQAWQRLIDSSQIGTARIDRTDSGVSYLQIKLNYGDDCLNNGMFTFKVSLYDAYVMRIYQISGYCYGGNHWYSPRAVKLAQAGTYGNVTTNYTNDTIYFRYDSNHNLYVYIRQEAYAGALISDVCNGYNHITNLNKIFSLSYVSSYDSTTAQGSADLVGTGSYDLQDYSAFVGKSRTPTTAGTITLHTYGKIKQLTIWGTTWAATSGAAQLVLTITISSNLCPTTNVEIMGHDDNGQAVFGYITNTGGVFIANRNAVPVYITATYI